MKNVQRHAIPLWLEVIGILALGILASITIVVTAPKKERPTHTVTFALQDGTVLETVEVEDGKGVHPPELTNDSIFLGWSTPINAITTDVEAHPMFHPIEEENLFYFDSVYVEEGKDFSLNLRLDGLVSISSGKVQMLYDENVLTFRNATSALEGCTISQTEPGVLVIHVSSGTPIKEACDLATVTFRAEEKDVYSTEVVLQTSETKIVTDGQELPANCATINNKVYFLQEVESWQRKHGSD